MILEKRHRESVTPTVCSKTYVLIGLSIYTKGIYLNGPKYRGLVVYMSVLPRRLKHIPLKVVNLKGLPPVEVTCLN